MICVSEIDVRRDRLADGVETATRPDGVIQVRLPPEYYQRIAAECEPRQSLESRVVELVDELN